MKKKSYKKCCQAMNPILKITCCYGQKDLCKKGFIASNEFTVTKIKYVQRTVNGDFCWMCLHFTSNDENASRIWNEGKYPSPDKKFTKSEESFTKKRWSH